jgi:hypothetical protein
LRVISNIKLTEVNKLLGICLFILLLIIGAKPAKADHVVGSDITYRCLNSSGLFEITFVFYRDCQGIPVCGNSCGSACSRSLTITGASPGCEGTNYGTISLQLISVRDVNPNPRCPNAKSICTNMNCVTPGSFTPGVERYEFRGTTNLGPASGIPASCCTVRISFNECCRNAAISTGATWANFFMEATINRCLSLNPCNSSPTLTNDPYAIICSGQPFVFNNGAVDPDLDSLSYSFAPALAGPNASVPYTPPYSWDRPMPWSGPANGQFPAGILCSPINGDIMFTPAAGGNFVGVMAIQIQQWRRNPTTGVYELVGTTRRDVQMALRVCDPNNPPQLRSIPGLNGNPLALRTNWEVCAGEQICFDVVAKDTDFNPPVVSDTTYLSWNGALAGFGATFLPNYVPAQRRIVGPREDNYRFCWTPAETMGSSLPYYFTIRADDSRCPMPGTITRAFSVRVFERAEVTLQKTDHKCSKWAIKYTKTKPLQVFTNTVWSVAREPFDYAFTNGAFTYLNAQTTPILQFQKPGKYLVQLTIRMPGPVGTPGCSRIFYDTFTVLNPLAIATRDTFVCRGGSLTITGQASSGVPPYTYRWFNNMKDTLPGMELNAPFFTNPNLTVAPASTRHYTIQIRDFNGCRAWDSVRVDNRALPIGILPDSARICFGSSFMLDAGGNSGNVKSYLWSTGDTTRTIERNDSGQYVVLITDTFSCRNRDTMMLYVNRKINARAGLDTAICFRDTATLRASGGQFYMWRNLNTGATLASKSHNPVLRVNPTSTSQPTSYQVTVYQSYPDTVNLQLECSVTDTVEVSVKPLPVLLRPQVLRTCFNEKVLNLNSFNTNQPGGTGTWIYTPRPGGVVNGTPAIFFTDSFASRPAGDTTAVFTNWIRYVYTAPESLGGCTNRDSAQVTLYGNPRVDAGTRLQLCENAGVYEVTTTANQSSRGVVPVMLSTNTNFSWSGSVIDSTTSGGSKRYFFNPAKPTTPKLPNINVVTYRFAQTYTIVPSGSITCHNSDTTQFVVTPIPVIDAGSDIKICKSNPILNLTEASGGFTLPATGQEYWFSPFAPAQAGITGRTTFNPAAIGVPNSGGPWKLYMRDTSTGCTVTDSTNLIIAPVPEVIVSFRSDMVEKETTLCKGSTTKQTIWTSINGAFAPGNTNPTDSTFSYLATSAWYGISGATGMQHNAEYDPAHPQAVPGPNKIIFRYTQITAGIGCTRSDSAIVNIQDPPQISVAAGGAMCSYDNGIPVSVTNLGPAAEGYTMTWKTTSGSGTFADAKALNTTFIPSASGIAAGSVQVTAETDAKGVCPTTSASTTVTIHKAPTAGIYCDSCEGCEPLTSYFGAQPTGVSNVTYQWLWNDGVTYSDSSFNRYFESYENHKDRKVKLVVATQTSPACYDTSTYTPVYVRAKPDAAFVSDPKYTTIAKPFFNFLNLSIAPDNAKMNYVWTFPPLAPSPTPRTATDENPIGVEFNADTGWIKVFLKTTTEYGCWDTTSDEVKVEPDITVFIPNAFRPLSDVGCPEGEFPCNQEFKIAANGYATIEIIIYNRWGQEVFRTNDASKGWKGQVNNKEGQDCPQDVYIYQIYATSFNGKSYKYSGSVTLLR